MPQVLPPPPEAQAPIRQVIDFTHLKPLTLAGMQEQFEAQFNGTLHPYVIRMTLPQLNRYVGLPIDWASPDHPIWLEDQPYTYRGAPIEVVL